MTIHLSFVRYHVLKLRKTTRYPREASSVSFPPEDGRLICMNFVRLINKFGVLKKRGFKMAEYWPFFLGPITNKLFQKQNTSKFNDSYKVHTQCLLFTQVSKNLRLNYLLYGLDVESGVV